MKELSIEEKAKRYDEAIDRAKKELDACGSQDCDAARQIFRLFSELKESEDERIRKDIIEMLRNWASVHYITKEQFSERMAWLEKQGSYTKKDVDDAYLKGISDAKNEIEKQYEASYQIRKDIATFIFNYRGDLKNRAKWMHYLGIRVSFVKNQDEKNPQPSLILKSALEAAKEEKVDNQNCVKPDKNEPEFHEGDFIVNDYCMGKVIEVTNDAYLLDTGQGIPFSYEHKAHLWTIQDAKDGDVLASDNGVIILVKESRGSSWGHRLSYHCAVLYDGTFEHREFHVNPEKFFPATKKQRGILFSKMKEAGYEWDADKKELKKIEDEPENYKQQLVSEITDLVEDYISQKPAWTEEDEKKLSDIISILGGGENCFYNSPILIDWLKSLKERIGG